MLPFYLTFNLAILHLLLNDLVTLFTPKLINICLQLNVIEALIQKVMGES